LKNKLSKEKWGDRVPWTDTPGRKIGYLGIKVDRFPQKGGTLKTHLNDENNLLELQMPRKWLKKRPSQKLSQEGISTSSSSPRDKNEGHRGLSRK